MIDLEPPLDGMVVHEVDETRWDDLDRLFEGPGGPRNCWCMIYRATPEENREVSGARRKRQLRQRIEGGTPVGLLAYVDDEPVAWCSIAPRETYVRLGGLEEADEEPGRVWSLVCFFIPSRYRRQGLMTFLIQAAVEHARAKGAQVVEAYPVKRDSPSYRFSGFVPTFEAAGFVHVHRAGKRRHVMRLTVPP